MEGNTSVVFVYLGHHSTAELSRELQKIISWKWKRIINRSNEFAWNINLTFQGIKATINWQGRQELSSGYFFTQLYSTWVFTPPSQVSSPSRWRRLARSTMAFLHSHTKKAFPEELSQFSYWSLPENPKFSLPKKSESESFWSFSLCSHSTKSLR